MSPTVHLVTGGGRGIGFALVAQLAAQPDTIVYAGVRTFPPAPDSQLAQLAAKHPSTVIPIKITSANEEDNAAAASLIKHQTGKVNVVIANAGAAVQDGFNPILSLTPHTLHADFEVNTVGPVVLFKAFHPLLLAANEASPGSAKFVTVSSNGGQIADALPLPFDSYGASKAAVNYLTKKIDIETPEVVAFPIHPGAVNTDGATGLLKGVEMPEWFKQKTPEESAKGVLAVIAKATKETHGGKFWDENGKQMTY